MISEFELQIEAQAQLELLKRERDVLINTRKKNSPQQVQISRKDTTDKEKLKSDLKKATAFVKRIRLITPDGIQNCIREIDTLNLALYISEIVSALSECKFKATDMPSIIEMCSKLHQRYDDFAVPLINSLKESLLDPSEEDDNKKKRMQLRMIIELFQVGIFQDGDFFCTLLRNLVGKKLKRCYYHIMSLLRS
jgi:regulator of nonsense transcripts 2